MVTWPAIIKCTGDDELTYVASQVEWDADKYLNSFSYDLTDVLIDSSGMTFRLSSDTEGRAIPAITDDRVSLEALTDLVRNHASQLGNCCVSKLYFYSITEAIAGVADINEAM